MTDLVQKDSVHLVGGPFDELLGIDEESPPLVDGECSESWRTAWRECVQGNPEKGLHLCRLEARRGELRIVEADSVRHAGWRVDRTFPPRAAPEQRS